MVDIVKLITQKQVGHIANAEFIKIEKVSYLGEKWLRVEPNL